MKLLHTSDWHLGKTLYGQRRYEEFENYLKWQVEMIKKEKIEMVIIAGDIFDTTIPSYRAQSLYFEFLMSVSTKTSCRHIIVIGGNHDSATLLNAPQTLLQQLRIHVVGSVSEDINNQVIVVKNSQNEEMAIIGAIPYLRDRDIREVSTDETVRCKETRLISGIEYYYQSIYQLCLEQKERLKKEVPIILTGHLFVTGSQVVDDEIRDLYVGSLGEFPAQKFPAADYIALGHIHRSQMVAANSEIRYSGSPLPMNFKEGEQEKSVVVVDFSQSRKISLYPVPCFQKLKLLKGQASDIERELLLLCEKNESVWVEIHEQCMIPYEERMRELDRLIEGSNVKLLRVLMLKTEKEIFSEEMVPIVEHLTPEEVFDHCLIQMDCSEEESKILWKRYREVLSEIEMQDERAE